MPIQFILDGAKYLDQQLGIIRGLKNKLVRQWDEAADKLVGVLEEISLIYSAIDRELSDYLSLDLADVVDVREGRKVLIRLEANNLRERMEEARGHCHKIDNVYQTYLKRWFDRVLKASESQQLESVFAHLSQYDYAMLFQIESLVDWLAPEAEATLDLIDAGNLQGANRRIRSARKEVLPTRRAVFKLMAGLRGLQAQFIRASGQP